MGYHLLDVFFHFKLKKITQGQTCCIFASMHRKLNIKSLIQHYNDVIMGVIASQITSPTIVYSTVYSGADQRKYQSSASLAFVLGIHRWPVNSPHKGPATRKMFPFDDVIMKYAQRTYPCLTSHRRSRHLGSLSPQGPVFLHSSYSNDWYPGYWRS